MERVVRIQADQLDICQWSREYRGQTKIMAVKKIKRVVGETNIKQVLVIDWM